MKIFKKFFLVLFVLLLPAISWAHFGCIIPSDSMIDQSKRTVYVTFSFIHPFEQNGMDLVKPKQAVMVNLTSGRKISLLKKLKETTLLGHKAWKSKIRIRRPGVYCIYMVPKPYWEPAEDKYIKHITKSYIAAFGDEDGWDKPVGLKTEVVPLTRPFGLYAGNVFQGQVLFNGKPVPNCFVEVEYYNNGGKVKAASEYMVTQVIRTDSQGVFTFAPPAPGWWGFSALNDADYTLKHNGKNKPVELGAVIWVKFLPWNK